MVFHNGYCQGILLHHLLSHGVVSNMPGIDRHWVNAQFSGFSPPPALAHWAGSKQLGGAAHQGYPSRCEQPWGARAALGCQKNSLSPPSHWAHSDSSANTDGFSQKNGAVKLQKQPKLSVCFEQTGFLDILTNMLYSSH